MFSENFFDPIAAAIRKKEGRPSRKIARLWCLTLVLNLIGGAVLVLALSVGGALPHGATETLRHLAEEIAGRSWLATLMRAIVGGALVALLSFLVIASRDTAGRIVVAYATGVLLALGPFEHAVVSVLHIGFGLMFGASVGAFQMAEVGAIAVAGNLIGGVGLVTLSHAAQAKGADED